MSLQVWLPLTKDLRQQGLSNVTVTNNGATFNSTGKLGGCYSVDNVKQIGCNNCISLGTTFSIAFWSKINSKNVDWGNIFKIYKDGADYIGMCLAYTTDTNPKLGFHIYRNNGSNAREAVIDGYKEYSLNNWFHTAITVTPTKAIVYKNGEIFNTFTISKSFPLITNYSLWLGKNGIGSGLDCDINDFRLYDHCLSPMEVKELAKGLVLHYPLNRQGWGQENLVWDTHWDEISTKWSGWGSPPVREIVNTFGKKYLHVKSSDRWQGYSQNQAKRSGVGEITAGEKLTLSCWAYSNTTLTSYPCIGIHWTDGSSIIAQSWPLLTITTTPQKFTTVLTVPSGVSAFNIMVGNGSGTVSGVYEIWVADVKLEKGEFETPWCPNSSDALATTMGLNSTTEYDCSGFCNNGTKNNITYTSDTPKYAVGSIFNGSNSYIKVDDNNWMIKGMSEMTVNIWAKATTWPTNGGRLLSCTETGGFNLEAGNSGYWRFPIYVYTNSGQTSSAYKYDSNEIKIADLIPNDWNMITLVYDNTGTKTYLNGELHHTYTNTSYGINFNTNARLFLGCEASTASPSSPYFNGIESDFRIYAIALSADDVLSLYQNSAYIDSSGNVYGTIHEV